ncbi:hypothetical protein EXIGLDRAFT_827704 [Exidia glandulosa HHB12029]|uniref:F-box domain-containing protein n=1 Tax=Exidia glandulosa HHB12029 TaxID=1314781 RepID=A0A166BSU6_EXIGL|nr:hypothetical protein EXIGLDRAFT_827704 [Exidia glandulosa HHB12029]
MTTDVTVTKLPPELIREIVELAARHNILRRPAWVARQLSLVSRIVHAWVHPILYRRVFIDDAHLRRFISMPIPPEFFAPTRCLILHAWTSPGPWASEHPPALFRHLRRVSLFVVSDIGLKHLSCSRTPYLTRYLFLLYVPSTVDFDDAQSPWPSKETTPWLCVTHLRILLGKRTPWTHIAETFPQLSHVFIDVSRYFWVDGVTQTVREALAALPRCERIVVRFDEHCLLGFTLEVVMVFFGVLVDHLKSLHDKRIFTYRIPARSRIPYERITQLSDRRSPQEWFEECYRRPHLLNCWDDGIQIEDTSA